MSDSRQETSADRSLEKRIEELQKRASKDELSGLLNRSTAEQYITARLDELQKDEMCALFIIDLDDFKRVNDTLGHIAGDQAIKKSAQILSALFRAKDIVGRLGGDEFIAFMSGSITEQEVRARAASSWFFCPVDRARAGRWRGRPKKSSRASNRLSRNAGKCAR